MEKPQRTPEGRHPHAMPWEAWRHASDGVAILSQDGRQVLFENPSFTQLCASHHSSTDLLVKALGNELQHATASEVRWRRIESQSGDGVRVGLLLVCNDPAAVLLMIPAAAEAPDIVTGLADRRHLERELERRFFSNRPFALVFIDLDGFKQVNDELGHVAGDRVLREIAQRMRTSLRDRDLVGRYGGDEFVVLIDGAVDPVNLGQIVQRLERAAAEPLDTVTGAGPLSASIGWAFSTDCYPGPAEMIAAADQRMYESKRQGC